MVDLIGNNVGENGMAPEKTLGEKIKAFCRKENLLVMVLCGVLLLVAAIPTGDTYKNRNVQQKSSNSDDIMQKPEKDYDTAMEEQLEQMLTQITNVGRVKVMITLQSSEEIITQGGNSLGTKAAVTKTNAPIVEGVLVIAQGADKRGIKQEITDICKALFDVEAHKVVVVKMRTD